MSLPRKHFRPRRDLAAVFDEKNPVLRRGELAWAYDARTLKIGDGVTPWRDLEAITKVRPQP